MFDSRLDATSVKYPSLFYLFYVVLFLLARS